jgi:transcriptional regulator with XRE-family HTH domain
MSNTNAADGPLGLVAKIARLAAERGWDLAQFAKAASLHRATAQQLLAGTARRLQDNTVKACADAFGLTPLELRIEPIATLVAKMRAPIVASDEIAALRSAHPELTDDDLSDVLAFKDDGEPKSPFAIEEHARRLERRRRLANKVLVVAGTEYIDLLEQFVDLLYEKVQPYADRGVSGGDR